MNLSTVEDALLVSPTKAKVWFRCQDIISKLTTFADADIDDLAAEIVSNYKLDFPAWKLQAMSSTGNSLDRSLTVATLKAQKVGIDQATAIVFTGKHACIAEPNKFS